MVLSDSVSRLFSASEQSLSRFVYPLSLGLLRECNESAYISIGIGPSYSAIIWTLCTNESA